MKILVKEKKLTSYDQEIYLKKLVETKLKSFSTNYRSNYTFKRSQAIQHTRNTTTQLPSISNKTPKRTICKSNISINEIIKQLPSHIDNSSIYKNQEISSQNNSRKSEIPFRLRRRSVESSVIKLVE
ncbi:hypothetical protein BCR32DRAFT_249926 [Anaeromyces robustus]|uniref:Uncharacterized protein n=1 Tax=Anaeromyces robustus TaxID=1754192 RepID=A0A1Y1WJT4_9FUNG|nr:hypothetical protein BCR32DRAFT_249926 [Anaeromyces robustus]|eukprot:ORX73476.1 hypothetical protein BCR32DRAFT_249926 [Anaeromyces robustus]